MKTLAFVAVVFPGIAVAAMPNAPGDYAYRATITVTGGNSHYRVVLPQAAYRGLQRSDLGDLRIFNAAGESVPYAFLPRQAEVSAPGEMRPVKLFPLYGDAAKGVKGMTLHVERTSAGTVVRMSGDQAARGSSKKLLGYIVDTGKQDSAFKALLLEWTTHNGFSGAARIESSDDLKRWATLAAEAPIIMLEHGGERLERRRVEIGGTRAPYLRISFKSVPDDFALRSARVELVAAQREVPREWLKLEAVQESDKPVEFTFDSKGRFPVDRARLLLPQANTVTPVRLFVRERTEDKWRQVASATAYRLTRSGSEATSPDVEFAATQSRYWLIRVDPKSGGLGSDHMSVELGYVPHELLFAARGDAPFALAYGRRTADPVALPIATVLPGYRQGEPISAVLASVGEPSNVAAPARSFFSDPGAALHEAARSGDMKKWILWAALGLGVAVIGWMASRLLRDIGKHPNQGG